MENKVDSLLDELKERINKEGKLILPHSWMNHYEFEFNWAAPAADQEELNELEAFTKYRIPLEHKQFLFMHNGATLYLDAPNYTQGLNLFSTSTILQYYEDYQS